MNNIKNTFGKNLEQIEVAKLKLKYEELGYKFYPNKKSKFGDLFFDAYARNPSTKDEIIFEVKAKDSVEKGDTEKLVKRRELILQHYPNARFVLVLAKKPSKDFFADSKLNNLLLEFIKEYKLEKLKPYIKQIDGQNIQSISINKLDFKDFKTIYIEGVGNFVFKHFVKNENFEGKILSDGVPFQFSINLINNFDKNKPYSIEPNSKITFDISEFKV